MYNTEIITFNTEIVPVLYIHVMISVLYVIVPVLYIYVIISVLYVIVPVLYIHVIVPVLYIHDIYIQYWDYNTYMYKIMSYKACII
jgi:hypothetical protein